jgi:hypothetical protein
MLHRIIQSLKFIAVTGAIGCAVESGEEVTSRSQALSFPAHEAALVLDLVNDPATDVALLDDAVRLDSRAAKNIIAHRNGPDGLFPSADDDLFDTLAELDAVPYVGDWALEQLRAWAIAHAPPPPELVEGVDFTSEQVAAVVWGVNQASVYELDIQVGLDRRAAENLVASAPYATVTAIGQIAYVGTSALNALRAHTDNWIAKQSQTAGSQAGTYDGVAFDEATAQAALGAAQTATTSDLTRAGMTSSGANAIVGGRPYDSLAQVSAVHGVGSATMNALHKYATGLLASGGGQEPEGTTTEGGECSASSECASGLICSGTTIYEYGFCRFTWMAGTFQSTTSYAIPDGDANGVESSIEVTGLASVPEDVIIHLDVDHPRLADLRVIIMQPSSADAVIWQVGSDGPSTVVERHGLERDSNVNGTWTLRVIDTVKGEAGILKGWSLELTSRWD